MQSMGCASSSAPARLRSCLPSTDSSLKTNDIIHNLFYSIWHLLVKSLLGLGIVTLWVLLFCFALGQFNYVLVLFCSYVYKLSFKVNSYFFKEPSPNSIHDSSS